MKHYSLRVYQALLFLLAAVPCGIPYRYPPNPVFPSELAAYGFCGLLILAAALLPAQPAHKRTGLPLMSLPWFLLAAVLAIQVVVLPLYYWSERTIPLAYLIGAGLTVWSLARARDEFTLQPLAEALAWGLLVGALFNSGTAVPQVIQVIKNGSGLVFGNIGQKNMYGHYLTWGIAAAAWLMADRKLPVWSWALLVSWLALSTAWCGSRSILVYICVWIVFGGVLFASTRGLNRRFAGFLLASAALMLAMQFIAPLISEIIQSFEHAKNAVPTGLSRLDSNGARRLVEWHKAWTVFTEHPILGIGWGAYGAESVRLQVIPAFARVEESVLFTHCHNSLLNLMAETGIIGTGVVVAPILTAFGALWRRRHDAVTVFAASLVLVSILHSLVEYPLWYFHFFGPFAVLLFFLFDATPFGEDSTALRRTVAIAAGALVFALGIAGTHYYIKLYPIMDTSSRAGENARRMKLLEELRENPLVDYFAEFGLSNFVTASRSDIGWKLGLVSRLNAVHPYPGQLSDESIMLALQGKDMALAHTRMRQAVFAFPESLGYFRNEVSKYPTEPNVQLLMRDVEDGEVMFGKRAYNPDDDSDE